MRLSDREQAGQLLADKLEPYRGGDTVVYALPRGGRSHDGASGHRSKLGMAHASSPTVREAYIIG